MRKIFILLLAALFIFTGKINAFENNTYVNIVNPIRGPEGWSNKFLDPLSIPKMEYYASTSSAIPVTWLLRYDAVNDASISAYFKNISDINTTQSIGALLELTPQLILKSGLNTNNFNSNLLTSFYPQDREKLIDIFMESFRNRFGFLPKSVGAHFIDSYSLSYLQKRYSVLVAVIDDESVSTSENYLWGGYLGSAYLPSKNNTLRPGASSRDRIDMVVARWNKTNLYNSKSKDSGFPDVKFVDQTLSQYSQNGFNEFNSIVFGLGNDFSAPIYSQDIKNIYQKISSTKSALGLHFETLDTFGNFVLNRYPESSPVYLYKFTDLNSETVFWYQNPNYRLVIKSNGINSKIVDFRVYNQDIYEDSYSTPNTFSLNVSEILDIIDSLKNPVDEAGLDFNILNAKVEYQNWRVTFTDGIKSITLNPQNISFSNLIPSIKSKDISVTVKQDQIIWNITPKTPFKPQINHLWFLFAIFIPLILVSFIFNQTLSLGLLFALLSTFTVIRSGTLYPFGLGIWGPNGHDAIFHISLIEKFSQSPFNLDHPQLSGTKLSNYHFVFDYLSGFISKIFSLSSITVYFVIFPIATSLAIVYLLSLLFRRWNFSSLESALSYFFVFLSGSLGFIPALISGQNPLYGESVFWANQSVSFLLNPPYALSIIVLLVFILLLEKYKKPSYSQLLFLGLVGGLLAQTKIYAFVLICLCLIFLKKFKELFAIGIVGILLTLPFSSVSHSPFTIEPLWFVKSMFASPDRIWWPKLVQAWQSYEAGGVWIKLLAINLFAVVVFLLGNLATRIISLRYILSSKAFNISEKVALAISVFGIIIPLIFIQNINPWNTIQFIYYSLFFLGIFAARGVVTFIKPFRSIFLKIIFILFILILSSITSFGTLQNYLGFYSSSRISYTELSGLNILRSLPRGIVLSPIFSEKNSNGISTPKPLYSYVSTAYISAFSGQPEYLSDTINLDITGFDYTERSRKIQRFYQTENKEWAQEFLKTENISYVYETPLQKIKLNPNDLCLSKIFDSQEINIYKFNCHGQN